MRQRKRKGERKEEKVRQGRIMYSTARRVQKRQFKVGRINNTTVKPAKCLSPQHQFRRNSCLLSTFLLSRKMQGKSHVFFVQFILSLNTRRLSATINQHHNLVRFVFKLSSFHFHLKSLL